LKVDSELHIKFHRRLEKGLLEMEDKLNYDSVTKVILSVAQRTLPVLIKKHNKVWFDSNLKEIKSLLVQRSAIARSFFTDKSESNRAQYLEMRGSMQKILRNMKAKYYEDKTKAISCHFDERQSHQQFKVMNNFIPAKIVPFPARVFRSDGYTLTDGVDETKVRVSEYARDLLNQESMIDKDIDSVLPPVSLIKWELDDPFTMEELKSAVNSMSINKACGFDNIPIELLKYSRSVVLDDIILSIWNNCLLSGDIPSSMKDAIIVMVFKKGIVQQLGNYRTLSLLSHIGKGLDKATSVRLMKHFELNGFFPDTQNGFRSKRSTVDSIFISQMVTAACIEKNLNCYKAFLDFVKAYDRVNQPLLWLVLKRRGVPPKLLAMIKGYHEGSMAQVKLGGLSAPFELTCGLRQGAMNACCLFNGYTGAMIEAIAKRVMKLGLGIKFRHIINVDIFKIMKIDKKDIRSMLLHIWNAMFADDIAVFESDVTKLQKILDIFVEVSTMYGMLISIAKSEVLAVIGLACTPKIEVKITVNGELLKNVTSFRYLGQIDRSYDNRLYEPVIEKVGELVTRSKAAYSNYFRLQEGVFENRDLTDKIKLLVYKVVVICALLYVCEVWIWSERDFTAIEHVQIQLLKRIFRLRDYRNRVSYLDLLMWAERLDVYIYPVHILVMQRQIRYLGEILRMKEDRTNSQLLHADMEGGFRYAGKQPVSYRGSLKKALLAFDFKLVDLVEQAKDERKWNAALASGKEKCYTKWIKANTSTSIYQTSEISYVGSIVKANTNKMLLARRLPTGATFIEDVNVTTRRLPRRFDSYADINEDIAG